MNNLFPIFIKLHQIDTLLVGGGNVGLEKLTAMLNNSPEARITLVAERILPEVKALASQHTTVQIFERVFQTSDMAGKDLIILATDNQTLHQEIKTLASQAKILTNVADTPALCDFYLSSVVQKGNLKIAISTNGKSPTVAKRIKETLNDVFPDEIDEVLNKMSDIRNTLSGDFAGKIKQLNQITETLAPNKTRKQSQQINERKWKTFASRILFAFFFMFLGHFVLSYIPYPILLKQSSELISQIPTYFYWMVLTGFLAQLIDGAAGMGYGVTCTNALLTMGIPMPAISGSIHTAEMFATGVSGYSHYRFGNINKKLFKTLLIPGVLGAITGALLLSFLGEKYGAFIKPMLACYTFFLGVKILSKAFKGKPKNQKVRNLGWLAGAGGFLDAFGGGGWGPLVTSTLISKGKKANYVVGSVSLTEFFVTFAAAVTFFSVLGVKHWDIIVALIIGSSIAAPLAARLVGVLPARKMLTLVGIMIIIWSSVLLVKTVGKFF